MKILRPVVAKRIAERESGIDTSNRMDAIEWTLALGGDHSEDNSVYLHRSSIFGTTAQLVGGEFRSGRFGRRNDLPNLIRAAIPGATS
jgi:hypothetical protein